MKTKRSFLLLCAAVGIAAFLAVGLFNNHKDIIQTKKRLQMVRQPGGVTGLPMGPFIWRGMKLIGFYVVGGAATGGVLGILALLLAAPKRESGEEGHATRSEEEPPPQNAPPMRPPYFKTYLVLLVLFLVYVHLRMATLHPALFDTSYLWAWFAGSPIWALVMGSLGKAVPVLLALYLLKKYWSEVSAFCARHGKALVACGLLILAIVGGLWGSKRLAGGGEMSNKGPNVIIIGLDSVRPDHVSWNKLEKPYPRPTTPNLDAFLDESVWFDQAFVPICRTYPSWVSTLTGCWPPTNGVRFDLPTSGTLHPRVPTLAQSLQKAGYRTSWFLDNTNFAWMDPELGFDKIVEPEHNVIDFYISSVSPRSILYYYFLNNRLGFQYDPGLRLNAAYRAIYNPKYMNEEIDRYLHKMRGQEKFFQAIHLCTIHVPFSVSYPYSTWFAPSFGPVLNRFGYRALSDEILQRKQSERRWTAEEAAWIHTQEVNLYDALVRSTDDVFGEILDSIRDAGLYDDSYIVVMSDHGENLPEPGLRYRYGSSTHGFFLWGDGDTRIMLAIKFPKGEHAGRQVKRLVRSIDIAPTLLDALGLAPLETADGVSRMSDVKGKADDRERWVYAETGLSNPKMFIDGHLAYEFPQYHMVHAVDPKTLKIYKKNKYEPNLINAKDRMIRTEKWKLIAYPVVEDDPASGTRLTHDVELFDVHADPNCVNDIGTTNPAVRAELFGRLLPMIRKDVAEFGTGAVRGISRTEKEYIRQRGF